jgi:50S ribosomal protein L16 3-hydroxylase
MLKSLSPDRFLADYWQKQPCFLPDSVHGALPVLGADELAWLATQPDVESRLVFTDRSNGKASYRVTHGPFSESALSELPPEDWTLLVQDVDKHLPDFRAYLNQIPFIPAWRIDDLMVSCAAPGGSVGPHKDNYDVFLCQGEGSRNWLVSEDRSVAADSTSTSLSLLEPFTATQERLCETGDVLYVPPGIPHWGIAKRFCITYSIGMRAPTQAELEAGCSRIFAKDADPSPDGKVSGNEDFYTDADLQASEAAEGKISHESMRRLREQKLLDESLSDEELATVLGSVVTDPKAWLDPDAVPEESIDKILRADDIIRVHGMTLITWCEGVDFRIVFANGSSSGIPDACRNLVRDLCVRREVPAEVVRRIVQKPTGLEFVRWLLAQGVMDPG